MKLTFLGAAGTVTGSKYLLEIQDKKILVDCGLFQGLKQLRVLNWQPPGFDPSSIDAILLTHGHLDHIGYLPRVVKLGFKGKIYATAPTLKISEITLRDSAKIQEEDAQRANQGKYSRHTPALPFYTLNDVNETIKLFQPVEESQWVTIADLFKAIFRYNGHILGSTFIQIEAGGKTLVFSGDVGREHDLLLYPPKEPEKADILLLESTYGDSVHADEGALLPELEQIVNETIEKNGSLFVPSFAVERTQLLMYMLWRLVKEKKIPEVPMIMDSPMGANILDLFHSSEGWHRLTADECNEMSACFQITNDYSETMRLRADPNPKIVIAGSGMMTQGRILSYMEVCASDPKNTLLFVGYQAEGTRGRKLLDGDKETKIHGKMIPVRMRIKKLDGLSAHGDQNDLLNWLSLLSKKPEKIFLIHGEEPQAKAFQQKMREVKQWDSEIPKLNQSVEF
jgi:metallo-beta-lactamase family protein